MEPASNPQAVQSPATTRLSNPVAPVPSGTCPSREVTARSGRRGRGWLARTARPAGPGRRGPGRPTACPRGSPRAPSSRATATRPPPRGSARACPAPRPLRTPGRCPASPRTGRRGSRGAALRTARTRAQQVRHGGPGVEGLAEAAQRDTDRTRPAQVGLGRREPQLGRTGGHRPDMVDHGAPRRVRRDELRRDEAAPCRGRPRAPRRRSRARREAARCRLLRPPRVRLGLRPRVADELVGQWPVGPARQTADPHQRLVRGSAPAAARPAGSSSMVRRAVPVRDPEAVEAAEEAELDATRGRAPRTWARRWSPHPGVHAPEDRPLEVEEHAPGELETEPRREAGPRGPRPRRRR